MTDETDGFTPAPDAAAPAEAIPAPAAIEPDSAPGQDADPASAAPPDPGAVTDDEPQKRTPWFQKRIDEVTRQKYEAQREADYWKGVAEGSRQPATQPEPATPPTLDECNWDEAEYQRRTAAFYRDEARKAAREELQSQSNEQRQQTQIQTAAAKMEEAVQKHADFMDVVHDFPLNDAVRDLLVEYPNGADVLYQVGKDPAEVRRIFSLSVTRQAVELGKIAARLEGPAASSPKPIPPAPPATVGAVSAGLNKAPEDMPMSEYIAWRKQQGQS